jgi:hypothetical protein
MAEDWRLRSLRGTRADPPHLAADDPYRRAIYGAGLEQFEQLLRAAGVAGPAVRPLLLFYALSQAGRSIVAARGTEPDIVGHGLAEDRRNPPPEDLLHRAVKRSPRQDGKDAFGAVSRAIGSPDLAATVELGALWAALPNTYRIPKESWLPEWRSALAVIDETGYRGEPGKVQVQAMSAGGNPHLDEVATLRDRYTSLPADTEIGVKPSDPLGAGNWFAVLSWDEKTPLAEVAEGTALDEGSQHLLPTLPGGGERPAELMIWWALIYGLSIFARYHPGLWIQALAVDASELAVPLEGVLGAALAAIPAMVLDEVFG